MAKKTTPTKAAPKAVVKSTVTVKELRSKSLAALQQDLLAVKKDLADARRSLAAGELVNPQVISMFKKTVARIETLKVQKMREESKGKED